MPKLTVKLTTSVYTKEVRVALRGAWWRRGIPSATIQSAKVVSYNAGRDYGGYGIRSSRLGRAYIAGGNRGVLLKLANQDQILLGSESPDELASAISRTREATR